MIKTFEFKIYGTKILMEISSLRKAIQTWILESFLNGYHVVCSNDKSMMIFFKVMGNLKVTIHNFYQTFHQCKTTSSNCNSKPKT